MIEMKQFKVLADNLMDDLKVSEDLKNRAIARCKETKAYSRRRSNFGIADSRVNSRVNSDGSNGNGSVNGGNGGNGRVFWRLNRFLVPAVCFVLVLGIIQFSGIMQLLNINTNLKSNDGINDPRLSRNDKANITKESSQSMARPDEGIFVDGESGCDGDDNKLVISSLDTIAEEDNEAAGKAAVPGADSYTDRDTDAGIDSADSQDDRINDSGDDSAGDSRNGGSEDAVNPADNDGNYSIVCALCSDNSDAYRILLTYEEAQEIFTGNFLKPEYLPVGYKVDEIRISGADKTPADMVCITYIRESGRDNSGGNSGVEFRIMEKHPSGDVMSDEKMKQAKPVIIKNKEGYADGYINNNIKATDETVHTGLYWKINDTFYAIEGRIDENTAISIAEGMN